MKSTRLLLPGILLFFVQVLKAQNPPDLQRLHTLHEKITTWQAYCNQLLGYKGEGTAPFRQLVVAGKQGLDLVPADSIRVRAMFSLFTGVAYEYILQYDSAQLYLNQTVQLARQINKTSYEMTALSRLDNIYDYTRNTVLRRQVMQRMEQIADTSGDLKIKEQAANALGGYYRDINDYEKSIAFRIRDIALYKEGIKKDSTSFEPLSLGFLLSNMGQVFNEIGQYDKALSYLNEARPYIGDHALKSVEETYYANFIQTFLNLEKPDSARHYYRLIYAAMKTRDTLYHVLCYANYFFGEYYYHKKNIDSAVYYITLARKEGIQSPKQDPYILATELLGTIYFEKGNYPGAISLLNETLKNNYEFHRKSFAGIHKTLAESYARLNKWDSAYRYFTIYSNLNDTLLNAAANKNFADAEARFQNNEKKLLIEAQEKELAYARTQYYWLLTGLVLAALIAALLMVIYRNKKKTADLLSASNNRLNTLNTELNEANKTKAKLFSIIGHDLRSPISQVHQYLKLQQLNPQALSEEQKTELSNQIQKATGSLLETMEDLLLWSKTQMSEFSVSRQQVSSAEIVNQVLELQQLNIRSKNLEVINHVQPHHLLHTDMYYLQTILRNLLQNAIKASPENGRILLESTGQSISISNQGSTFTQAQYEAVVQDTDASKGLSGLGLKLVDELSRKIDARITFTTGDDGSTRCTLHI